MNAFEAALEAGFAACRAGRFDVAGVHFLAACAAEPLAAAPRFALGHCQEATGNTAAALVAYADALRCDPNHVGARINAGRLEAAAGHHEAAMQNYVHALERDPRNVLILNNIGELLQRCGQVEHAAGYLELALDIDPGYANAWHNLGNVRIAELRLDAAIECFGRACELAPDNDHFADSLLLARLCSPEESAASLADAHRRWGEGALRRVGTPPPLPPSEPYPGRPLRLGFVSGDFRLHPVAQFLQPLLQHLDRRDFTCHAYSTRQASDAMSAALRPHFQEWREVGGWPLETLWQQVVADRIDILVDLAGHTDGNRLDLFARRAAPVQLAWLGYLGPSGLPTMDFRIGDHVMDPPGASPAGAEPTLPLPGCLWCYAPLADVDSVPELPLRTRGHPTFASFNNPIKLGPGVIALWAELLHGVPDAVLLFGAIASAATAAALERAFAARGIPAARLHFLPKLPVADYLATLAEADLALDPFPYGGGTTTLDCLWMGVPVVTLAGSRTASRGSASILTTLGLPQLIADSPAAYLEAARRLVGPGTEELARLRRELRSRIAASPLTDAHRYAQGLGSALHVAWSGRKSREKPN